VSGVLLLCECRQSEYIERENITYKKKRFSHIKDKINLKYLSKYKLQFTNSLFK